MRVFALALVVALLGGCGPARLRYTIRIESEPPGAKVYDPRTDEVVGETPYDVPVEYERDSGAGPWMYVRRRTAVDPFTPQDPASGKPHYVRLDTNDSLRVLVAKEGFEKAEQIVDWYFTSADGQVVRKRIFLRPIARPQGAADDVYR